jgi:hypothetical protein
MFKGVKKENKKGVYGGFAPVWSKIAFHNLVEKSEQNQGTKVQAPPEGCRDGRAKPAPNPSLIGGLPPFF